MLKFEWFWLALMSFRGERKLRAFLCLTFYILETVDIFFSCNPTFSKKAVHHRLSRFPEV